MKKIGSIGKSFFKYRPQKIRKEESSVERTSAPEKLYHELKRVLKKQKEFQTSEKNKIKQKSWIGKLKDGECPKFSKKVFGNFFLGASLENSGFEGLNLPEVTESMDALFEWMEARKDIFDATFIPQQKIALQNLKEQSKALLKGDSAAQLAQQSAKCVDNLKPGESYVMKGGWIQDPSGHAVYYQFCRNKDLTYDFIVYNAQEGVELQQGFKKDSLKQKGSPLMYFKDVPRESILFSKKNEPIRYGFFEKLWEIQKNEIPDQLDNPLFYLLAPIKNHQVRPPKHLEHFITLQRSGNCEYHSFAAMMLGILSSPGADPKETIKKYKSFIFSFKTAVLLSFYESQKKSLKADHQAREMLKEGCTSFCRRFVKDSEDLELGKEVVDKALFSVLDIMDQLEELEQKIKSERTLPSVPEISISTKHLKNIDRLEKIIKNNLEVIESKKTLSISSTKIVEFEKQKNVEDHVKNIEKAYTATQKLLEERTPQQALFQIDRLVRALPIPKYPEKDDWKPLNHADLKDILEKLSFLFQTYLECSHSLDSTFDSGCQNTLFHLVATLEILALEQDKKGSQLLDGYYLDASFFQNIGKNSSCFIIEDPKEKILRDQLLEYFEKRSAGKAPLFTYRCNHLDHIQDLIKNELVPILDLLKSDSKFFKALQNDLKDDLNHTFIEKSKYSLSEKERIALFLYFYTGEVSIEGLTFNREGGLRQYYPMERSLEKKDLFSLSKKDVDPLKVFQQTGALIQAFCRKVPPTLENTEKGFKVEVTHDGIFIQFENDLKMGTKDNYPSFNRENREELEKNTEKIPQENHWLLHVFEEELKESLDPTNQISIHPYDALRLLKTKFETVQKNFPDYHLLLMKLFTDSKGIEESPLFHECATQKGFQDLCKSIFSSCFQKQALSLLPSKPHIKESLWIIRLAQKIARTGKMKEGGEALFHDNFFKEFGFNDLNHFLDSLLDFPLDKEEKGEIHLLKVTEYLNYNFEKLKEEQWKDLFISWIHVKNLGLTFLPKKSADPFHSLFAMREINQALRYFEEKAIQDPLFTSSICESLLKEKVAAPGPEIPWICTNFPCFRKTFGESFWEINLFTGEILNQEGVLEFEKDFYCNEPLFKRLFNTCSITCNRSGETYYYKDDKLGPIKIISGKIPEGIYREIEGKWYQLFQPDQLLKIDGFPKILVSDYSHWVNKDSVEMVFSDLKTGKIKYHLKNSKILSLNETGEEIELFEASDLSIFKKFESISLIQLLKNEKKRTRIQLPRFTSQRGTPLEFEKGEGNKWYLKENPNYFLDSFEEHDPFFGFEGVLPLVHKKNPSSKVYIIPNFTIESKKTGYLSQFNWNFQNAETLHPKIGTHSYFSISYMQGELKAAHSDEAAALVYLFAGLRKYELANHFLKQISMDEEISSLNLEHLIELCDPKVSRKFCDASGNMAALRLRIAKKIAQFKEEEINWGELTSDYEKKEKTVSSSLKIKSFNRERNASVYQEGVILRQEIFPLKPLWEREEFLTEGNHDFFYEFSEENRGCYIPFSLKEANEPLQFQRNYPLERLWKDYRLLTDSDTSESQKQELIFKLSLLYQGSLATRGALWILKKGYLLKEQAPKPPSNLKKETLDDWAYQLKQIPVNQIPFPSTPFLETISLRQSEPSSNPLNQKLRQQMWGEAFGLEFNNYRSSERLGLLREKYLIKKKSHLPKRKASPKDLFVNKNSIGKEEDQTSSFVGKEEQNFQSVIEQEVKIYQEEWKIGRKENDKTPRFTQKTLEELQNLQGDLTEEEARSQKLVDKLQKTLLFKTFFQPDEQIAKALKAGTQNIQVQLRDLVGAFGAPSEKKGVERLQKLNPSLTEEGCLQILKETHFYLLELTNLAQVQRTTSRIEELIELKKNGKNPSLQNALWAEAAALLNERLQYDPVENRQALVFEALSGLRIRYDQARMIKKAMVSLFEDSDYNLGVVFQLIMGGGKTSVILSQLVHMASEHGKIPIFLCHHSQYSSVLGDLKENQKSRFGQKVVAIELRKGKEPIQKKLSDLKVLKDILFKVKEAKRKKSVLVMKTTLLQSLDLQFKLLSLQLGQSNDAEELKAIGEKLKVIGELLDLFKNDGIGFFDEIDINLNILQGVHVPLGKKTVLKKDHVHLVKNLYTFLLTDPYLKKYVRLDSNQQNYLSEKVYEKKVVPRLAKLIVSELEEFGLYPNLEEAFYRYLSGKIPKEVEKIVLQEEKINWDDRFEAFYRSFKKPRPDKSETLQAWKKDADFLSYLHHDLALSRSKDSQKNADLIALSKYLIQNILPSTLKKCENRNYGRIGMEAAPFLGVGTPANTEFANMYEKCAFHFQLAANKGISLLQAKKLVKVYFKQAISEKKGTPGQTLERTQVAKKFRILTGMDLMQAYNDPEALQECINRNPLKRLEAEEEVAEFSIDFNEAILSSGSISVVNKFFRSLGCSGTIWNSGTYHKILRDGIIPTKGTEGKILDKIFVNHEEGKSKIYAVKEQGIAEILKTSFKQREDSERIRGLIDAGGLLKRYQNIEVAEKVIEFFHPKKESSSKKSKKAEIQGVVFTYKNPETEIESPCLLKKIPSKNKRGYQTKILPLDNTSEVEISKYGIDKENLFFYYDDLRATGTDYKQVADAINIVTFDPQSTTMRSFVQAVLRLRGYFNEQNADFCYPEISKKFFIENPDDPGPLDFVKVAIRNQALEKGRQLYRSFRDQIEELFKKDIEERLQHMVLKDFNLKNYKKAVFAFYDFLCETMADAPYPQFASILTLENPGVVIERYFKTLEEKYRKALTDLGFSKKACNDALVDIQTEADLLIEEAKNLLFEVEDSETSLNEEAQVEVNKSKLVQAEKEVQSEVDINEELLRELQYSNAGLQLMPYIEEKWAIKDAKKPPSFSNLEAPAIFTLPKMLKQKFKTITGLKNYPKDYSKVFLDNLEVTENFQKTTNSVLPVFNPLQKEIGPILIVREEVRDRFIAVSKQEAAFFKKWIRDHKPKDVFLITPEKAPMESKGEPLPNDPEFQDQLENILWYVHLFNGDVDDLILKARSTRELLREEGYQERLDFLQKMAFRKGKEKFLLVKNHPLFQPPEISGTITKEEAKILVGKERVQELQLLKNVSEIRNLPSSELYFVKTSLLNELPPKKLRELPGALFNQLPKKQIKNISPWQVPFITEPELIQEIEKRPELVRYFGKEKSTAKTQINHLNPSTIPHLSYQVVHRVPLDRVKYLQGEEQIGAIRREQASEIAPEQVIYLAQHFVDELKTREQISYLLPDQVPALTKAEKIGLVPKHRIKFLSDKQIASFARADVKILPSGWKQIFKNLKNNKKRIYFSHLHPSQFLALPHEELESIFEHLPTKYFSQIRGNALNFFSKKHLVYLNLAQIQSLNSECDNFIKLLTAKNLESTSFSLDQVIDAMPAASISLLSKEQIRSYKGGADRWRNGLSPDRVTDFSNRQMRLLNGEIQWDRKAIAHLSKNQLHILSDHEAGLIPFLSQKEVHLLNLNKLNPSSWNQKIIERLDPKIHRSIISKVQGVAVNHFSANILPVLSKTQIRSLKRLDLIQKIDKQFSLLSGSQVALLLKKDPAKILSKVTQEQWSEMSEKEFQSAKIPDKLLGKIPNQQNRLLTLRQIEKLRFAKGGKGKLRIFQTLRLLATPILLPLILLWRLLMLSFASLKFVIKKNPHNKKDVQTRLKALFPNSFIEVYLAFLGMTFPALYLKQKSRLSL